MDTPVSPWASTLFNDEQTARTVRERIGQALVDMQANARASQQEAEVTSTQVHGVARYRGAFERVSAQLADIPGAQLVKPNGFQFDLVRIGSGLLYPFCFTKKDANVRTAKIQNVWSVIRELFAFAPPSQQADLFGEYGFDPSGVELRPRLAALPEGTRLVLVPFACNAAGLLKPYWGVAALADESGTLEWIVDPEPLPLADAPTPKLTIPQQVAGHPGFDQGEQPIVELAPRSNAERKLGVPPVTEAAPVEPLANESDEN
ncbi:hypothetical protein [Streptomyces rhizosphaericus]|uniref:Uncharacterized protein n=1 Tax=Streptomyces rhizosphaericus TaxID=114699 RepID=A0A6G4AEW0_9ACTN|nr:hypothetical protein [Streptomyces rhizosphaericus]NEW71027.1 hypothetical protein [Streptomyces rhizosphaericus]